MFCSPKDAPFEVGVHRFDIDDWQFVFCDMMNGDRYAFQWSELVHKPCRKPFRFIVHNGEVRAYCKHCDIRMPLETWPIVKSLVGSLQFGNKLA